MTGRGSGTNASGLMQIVPPRGIKMVDALIDSCDLASKPDSLTRLSRTTTCWWGIYTLDWLTQRRPAFRAFSRMRGAITPPRAIAEGYEPTDCEASAGIHPAARRRRDGQRRSSISRSEGARSENHKMYQSEGQFLQRCSDNGKWNRTWMNG